MKMDVPREIMAAILHFLAEPSFHFLNTYSLVQKNWHSIIKEYFLKDSLSEKQLLPITCYLLDLSQVVDDEHKIVVNKCERLLSRFCIEKLVLVAGQFRFHQSFFSKCFTVYGVSKLTLVGPHSSDILHKLLEQLHFEKKNHTLSRVCMVGCSLHDQAEKNRQLLDCVKQQDTVQFLGVWVDVPPSFADAIQILTTYEFKKHITGTNLFTSYLRLLDDADVVIRHMDHDLKIIRKEIPNFHPGVTPLELWDHGSSLFEFFLRANNNANAKSLIIYLLNQCDLSQGKYLFSVLYSMVSELYIHNHNLLVDLLEEIKKRTDAYTLLKYACRLPRWKSIIVYLLPKNSQLLDKIREDGTGNTVIHLAIQEDSKQLWECFAPRSDVSSMQFIPFADPFDINVRNNMGENGLFMCAKLGYYHFTKSQIVSPAFLPYFDMFSKNTSGLSFLDVALECNQIAFCQQIVKDYILVGESGISKKKLLNLVSQDWWLRFLHTTMQLQLPYGTLRYDAAKLIGMFSKLWNGTRDNWMNVAYFDTKQNSLLHLACYDGRIELVSALLDSCLFFPDNELKIHFLTNQKNSDGNTPFHLCCKAVPNRHGVSTDKQKAYVIRMLLRSYLPKQIISSVVCDIKNNQSQSALDIAKADDNQLILQALEEATNSKGKSEVKSRSKIKPQTQTSGSKKRKTASSSSTAKKFKKL